MVPPCAVQYPKYDDYFIAADEENSIGETLCQYTPHFRLAAQAGILKRIGSGAGDCRFDFGEQFVAEPHFLVVIPDRCVGDIHLSFGSNDNAMVPPRHG